MIGEITLGLVVLNLLVTVWALRILVLEIKSGMGQLDSSLAAAIQKVLEGGSLGDFEPVNPIQKALADMLTNRITQGEPFEVRSRTPSGKFAPDSDH